MRCIYCEHGGVYGIIDPLGKINALHHQPFKPRLNRKKSPARTAD